MPDGRQVAIKRSGNPEGVPIIGFHGSPGSRLGPWPRGFFLHMAGLNLISFDRPGYGLSDRLPNRAVCDVVADVEQIADRLEIERFAVNGRSGGVPYALGCAALLGTRVANVVAMVGIAPRANADEWEGGMTDHNKQAHNQAKDGNVEALAKSLEALSQNIQEDRYSLLNFLEPDLTDADREIVDTSNPLRPMVAAAHAEGSRQDAAGWIDDTLAANKPWGFELEDIVSPTIIWHGEYDPFAPAEHAKLLASKIKQARLVIYPGASHFSNLRYLPRALAWQRDNFEN